MLRDAETRETRNRVLKAARQFLAGNACSLFKEHGRHGIEVEQPSAKKQALPKGCFTSTSHKISINVESLTKRATWPSFTPQSVVTLAAPRYLLRFLNLTDDVDLAQEACRSILLPLGTIFRRATSLDNWDFVAGPGRLRRRVVHEVGVGSSKTKDKLFKIALPFNSDGDGLAWQFVIEAEDWVVLPIIVSSPFPFYFSNRKAMHTGPGICWQLGGPGRPLLQHASWMFFWTLSLAFLLKLMRSDGLATTKKLRSLVRASR